MPAPWEEFASTPEVPPWEEFAGKAPEESTAKRLGSAFVGGVQDIGAGLLAGGGRLTNILTAPLDIGLDALTGQPLGTTNRQRGQDIETLTRPLASRPDSLNYVVSRTVPEFVATGGALAGVTNAVAQGARRMLPQALARFAPAAADVGVQSAYEGSKALLQGNDVGQASKEGATGAAVGHGVGGVIAHGVKPLLGAAARRLADAGVDLTPGQMLGRAGQFVEDLVQGLPFTGAIDRAQARSMRQYSRAEVNEALKPLGVSTTRTGEDAVADGRRLVSEAYERVKPYVSLPPTATDSAVRAARGDWDQLPMLDDQQRAQITGYVDRRIAPHILNNRTLSGDEFKRLDSELGTLANQYRTAGDPRLRPLGDAFAAIQDRLRDALVPGTAGAKAQLQAANSARRALYPIEDAARAATGKIGHFTPTQMSQAANRIEQHAGELNRAGRELLTDKRPLGRTLSRVGLGGGGAATAAAAQAMGVPGVALGAGVAAGTSAVSNLLYNPVALKFILHGLSMSPHGFSGSARMLAGMPPQQAASEIQRLMQTHPSFAQSVAQLGRLYQTQQGAAQ